MFIEVPGAKLFALRHGDRTAQTIVGVGGWVGNSELWADVFALLSDRFSAVAYDHRGTGVSVTDPGTITLDALVNDVFAVMDAFDVERAVVAAESAGAYTALVAALERPERISHLVVVDGAYDEAGDPDPGWVDLLLTDYQQAIGNFVRDCIPEDEDGRYIEWGMKTLNRAAPDDAVALLGVTLGANVRDRLEEIAQPTLVVHGARDTIVPMASSEHLASALPNAELLRIADAGHVPTVTRPDVVAEAIAEFLERNP